MRVSLGRASMTSFIRLQLALFLTACATSLSAPSSTLGPGSQLPSVASSDSVCAGQATQYLIAVLRSFAITQEARYADSAHYARSVEDLRFPVPPPASLVVTFADGQAWAVVARHRDWPRRSCVMWVGVVPDSLLPKTDSLGSRGKEGAIACDS